MILSYLLRSNKYIKCPPFPHPIIPQIIGCSFFKLYVICIQGIWIVHWIFETGHFSHLPLYVVANRINKSTSYRIIVKNTFWSQFFLWFVFHDGWLHRHFWNGLINLRFPIKICINSIICTKYLIFSTWTSSVRSEFTWFHMYNYNFFDPNFCLFHFSISYKHWK